MKVHSGIAAILSGMMITGLCITPEGLSAQQSASQQQPDPNSQSQQQQTTQQPGNSGTTVNPSQAPLAPVTSYPDASGTPQQEPPQQPSAPANTTTTVPAAPEPQKPAPQPLGAATAEGVPTAGGAAAKPAGAAIAPAKQHQTRALVIKIAAIAAAGAAAGAVFALSRGTSPTPPGAAMPGAVPK